MAAPDPPDEPRQPTSGSHATGEPLRAHWNGAHVLTQVARVEHSSWPTFADPWRRAKQQIDDEGVLYERGRRKEPWQRAG